jgi:hypothetical protein
MLYFKNSYFLTRRDNCCRLKESSSLFHLAIFVIAGITWIIIPNYPMQISCVCGYTSFHMAVNCIKLEATFYSFMLIDIHEVTPDVTIVFLTSAELKHHFTQ